MMKIKIPKGGHRIRDILLAFTAAVLAVYIILLLTPQKLTASYYTLETDLPVPLRIVHLSDLHSAEYGENNQELVQLVAAQEPDLIVFTGDMFSRYDKDCDVILHLTAQLSEIAPVYYGLGNHETSWWHGNAAELPEMFAQAGATVLECDFVDVEINGVELRIGGFSGYYGFTHMSKETEQQKEIEQNFYDTFTETDRYKILLNHIPTQWLDWNHINDWHQDLVLCGHYHGGQIRIFGHGLVAPNVGLFPKYTKGCFVGETATCVLSAGLGNEYAFVPRINNPPEIVVIDLIPEVTKK